ncbi:hypothetical protein [Microbacterium sp. P04]|uniref:Rv0361 family membrane protein n=1 Tax=Microbacterium sp. P04 TaxID=3366947 RepID=UPI0037464DDF
MIRRPRALLLAVLAATAGVALVSCAPAAQPAPSTEGGGAEATITDFVEALSDGRLADALELSTAEASDFACPAMVSNGADMAMAAPEVIGVEERGDRATAEVSYSSPDEQSETFDLVREEDDWRVELPESFEIAIGFDAPVVAELVVEEDCRIPVEDAKVTVPAWPGTYRIDIVDPTGVLDRWEQMIYSVPGGSAIGLDVDPASLPAVSEGALSVVQGEAASVLSEAMADCVAAGFTGARCPTQLAGATVAPGSEPGGQYSIIDRVWTDDGRQWQFETRSDSVEGATAPIEFRYRGTLGRTSNGALSAQFTS